MARVIISAGHSNTDPGTIANGLREVDVARSIAKAITPHLRQNGVLTLSVPYELDLKGKIDWINKTGYKKEFRDICIEIHANEADGKKSGVEIWYEGQGGNDSQKLADSVLDFVTKEGGLENQGSHSELKHEFKSLAFVSSTSPIGVLVEAGYLDNPKDAAMLKDESNIQKIGKSIAKGILKFLNIEYKEVKVVPVAQPQKPITPPPVVPSTSVNQSVGQGSTFIQPNPQPTTPAFTPPSSFNNNSFSSGMGSTGGNNSYLASRDDRKEMINKTYIKILGREPNQSDLNYFLNTGINEDQLIKKMIDSQEHVDLVKARQEVLTTKAQFHAHQAELIQLRAETKDKTDLINNLNNLLGQKNIALTELHRKLQYYEAQLYQKAQQPSAPRPLPYKEPMMDRIFRYFSDRLG